MVSFNAAYRRLLREVSIGSTQPSLEARELFCLAMSRAGINADFYEQRLSPESAPDAFLRELDSLLCRWKAFEPLAYLIGEWDFYSLTFSTPPGVLIPRPETETLVDAALEGKPGGLLLDLCCGTGCAGIAIMKNSDMRGVFADLSPLALEITAENLRRHNLTGRAELSCRDALESPAEREKYDLIVSNPPYIPSGEIANLDRSVRNYEPLHALDGGADGLEFFRRIAENYRAALKLGGRICFECGRGQADAVAAILRDAGYGSVETRRDLAGVARVVMGMRGL